jgi:hypothetical protein
MAAIAVGAAIDPSASAVARVQAERLSFITLVLLL